MSIANKLTYLNTTKGKIKDSINLTGANIGSNDTFRSYAAKLRDGLLDIINNGTATLYNNFPKVSGTGSSISLSNTLEAPMNINKLDGDTKQQILPSGYTQVDYIQSSGTQYIDTDYQINNKCSAVFEYEYISGNAISGVYNRFDNDLYFGIIRSSTNNYAYRYGNDFYGDTERPNQNVKYKIEVSLKKGNQYLKINDAIITTSNNNSDITNNLNCYIFSINRLDVNKLVGKIYYFKLYDNDILVRDFVPCYRNSDNKVGMYDLIENRFYENAGTGAFTYGSIVPTSDSPLDIQCVEGIQNITISDGTDSDTYEVNLEGKNLFDKNAITPTSYFIQDGSIVTSSGNYCISDYIPVIAGQNYTYQGLTNVGTDPYSVYYDNNKEIVSTFKQQTGINTITIPNNVAFVRFSIRKAGGDDNTFMIEYGNQATSYVPYRTPIKLYNGDYITGTPDNWSIYRENGRVILDETSTNIADYVNTNLTNVYGFSASITGMNNITSAGTSYCNILNKIVWNYNYDNESYYLSNNTFVFKISKTIIDNQTGNTTIDKLKSYLAANNLHLVGKLATPTTETITDTYLISQLNALYNAKSKNGQTNISVSGQLPMIIEVSALKDEI